MIASDPLSPLLAVAIKGLIGRLVVASLILALFGTALAAAKARLRGAAGESRVRRLLRRLGLPSVHDVIVAAPDGSLTQIDHVALTGQGLVVIETKNYSGVILGTPRDRHWTQVLGRSRHRFQNPLRQNHKHILALNHQLSISVASLVVFVGNARFPDGPPGGVVTLHQAGHTLAGFGRPDSGQCEGPVWQKLLALTRAGRGLGAAHRAGLRRRRAP